MLPIDIDDFKKELSSILEKDISISYKFWRMLKYCDPFEREHEYLATVQDYIRELLVKEALERPVELYNCLLERRGSWFDMDRPMVLSCIKYLYGYEIVEDSAEERNIVILSNKRVSPAMSRVLALDLRTSSIISLVDNSQESGILAEKASELKRNNVVKVNLQKIKHKDQANAYIVSSFEDIVFLGKARVLKLFDKCCRCYKNIYYDRSDYDDYVEPSGYGGISAGDNYPVSSFDEVIDGVFEVNRKQLKYFLVNFTGSKILPHKKNRKQYQIKMRNYFVNVDVTDKDCGKYFRGVALLRSHINRDGKKIFFAEELFCEPVSASVLEALNKNNKGNVDFISDSDQNESESNDEQIFDDEYNYEDYEDNQEYYPEETLRELELYELEGYTNDEDFYSHLDGEEADIERFSDERDFILEHLNSAPDSEDYYDLLPSEEKAIKELQEIDRLATEALVYVVSDINDDNFALNYDKMPYKKYMKILWAKGKLKVERM